MRSKNSGLVFSVVGISPPLLLPPPPNLRSYIHKETFYLSYVGTYEIPTSIYLSTWHFGLVRRSPPGFLRRRHIRVKKYLSIGGGFFALFSESATIGAFCLSVSVPPLLFLQVFSFQYLTGCILVGIMCFHMHMHNKACTFSRMWNTKHKTNSDDKTNA